MTNKYTSRPPEVRCAVRTRGVSRSRGGGLPRDRGPSSRVELSLSDRGVTIGTGALAYLSTMQRVGVRTEQRKERRGGEKERGGERKTKRERTRNGNSGKSDLLVGREKAHTIRNANHRGFRRRRASVRRRKGGDGRRLTQRASSTLLLLLPVTCTSRVCLPASRSGSYLHSADEAATVLRNLSRKEISRET